MRRTHIPLLVSSLVFLLLTGVTKAQSHGKEQIMGSIRGATIETGANVTVTDLKFMAWQQAGSPGTYYSQQPEYRLVSSDLIVRLKHEEDVVDVIENTFDIVVAFTLSRKLTNGATTNETITNETIRITYDPLENSVYQSEKLLRFVSADIAERLVDASLTITGVTITSTSLTEVPDEVHLDLIIDQTRIYDMTAQSAPTLVLPGSATGSWINLSWSAIEGAHSYDLEWVFVETPGTHYDFNNANRINVANNATRISKLLPIGNVVFRVRAVGLDPTQFADGKHVRTTTPWSTTAPVGTVVQATGANPPYGLGLSAFNTDLNWTAQTNYAENGKSIETINYFDGLGKSRQNLTSFRADGNVVVSESIYDLDGRESVNMMPVPRDGLNLSFQTNGSQFLHGNFGFLDFGTNGMLHPFVTATPSPLPSNSVYRRYYSSNNSMNFEGKEFLPDAQGYAYTQQSYTRDGTDQVKYVSAPGGGFHLGQNDNHFMRYSYAKPMQPELNRLFGTEVGDKTHYSKNMITDQNGQITVQYLDRKGRLIASAYAGPTPAPLVDLDGREQPVTITDTLTRGNHPAQPGDEIQLVYDVAMTSSEFTIRYGLETILFNDACIGITDREITYEVLIEVEDDDGNLMANAKLTTGPSPSLTITTFTAGDPIGFVPVGDPQNTSTTTATDLITIAGLEPGKSYKITRRIRINEADRDAAMDLVAAKLESDLEDYKANPTSTAGCLPFNYEETETCLEGCREQCIQALSLEIDGVIHYITEFGTDDGSPTGGIGPGGGAVDQLPTQDQYTTDSNDVNYQALLAACLGECDQLFEVPDVALSTCESTYAQMLADMSPGGQYFDNTPYRYELDPITLEYSKDANGDFIEVSNYTSVRNNWLTQNIGSFSGVTGSWPPSITTWNQLRDNWDDAYADDLVTYHPEYAWYDFSCQMTSVDVTEQCVRPPAGSSQTFTLDLAASREFDAWLRSITVNCDASSATNTIGGTSFTNVNLFYPLGNYNIVPTTNPNYGTGSPTNGIGKMFLDPQQVSGCTPSSASAAIIDPLVPSTYIANSLYMAFMRSRLLEMVDMSQQPMSDFSASIYYVLFDPETLSLPTTPVVSPTPLEALKNVMWTYHDPTSGQLNSKTEFELFREQYLYWKKIYLRYVFETYVAPPSPAWALDIDDDGYYGETYDIYNNQSFEFEVDRYRLFYRQDLQERAILDTLANYDDPQVEHCKFWFNIPMGLTSGAANGIVETLQGQEIFIRCADQADVWLADLFNDPCFDAQGLTGSDLDAYKRAIRFKMIDICSEGAYIGNYYDGSGTVFVNNLYGHSHPNAAPWNLYTNPNNAQEQGPYAAVTYTSSFDYTKPNTSQISFPVNSINTLITGLGQTGGCTMDTVAIYNGADVQQQIIDLFDVDATGDCTCGSLLADIQSANPGTPGLVWSDPDPTVTDLEDNLNLVTSFLNGAPYSMGITNPYAARVVRFCAKTGYEELADVDGTAVVDFPHELECEACKCENLWGVIENQLPAINTSCATSVALNDALADRGWSQFGSCVQNAIASELNTLFGLGSGNPLAVVNGWITACANSTDREAFTDFPEGLRCLDNGVIEMDPCSTEIREQDLINAIVDYEQRAAEYLTDAYNAYMAQAWNNIAGREYLTLSYELNEYYYTLYVYDQADNLVKTVPPKGVLPLDLGATLNMGSPASGTTFHVNAQPAGAYPGNYTVDNAINLMRSNHEIMRILPKHFMETRYMYNSMNQVYEQRTPDGGITQFWYNDLEQLIVSQNAQQLAEGKHSYTIYDDLNRPVETGVLVGAPAMTNAIARSASQYASWFGTYAKQEVTRTIYDEVPTYLDPIYSSQNFSASNTRNRIVAVLYYDQYNAAQPASYQSAYHYAYDVHGNVNDLLSEDNNGNLALRFKRVQYDFDILSGNVNEVHYQPGAEDAFYHRYTYDDNNRLQKVETSQDYLTWALEARYFYYPHGPLRRAEVGNKHVQATDYAYTLQGWVKGVNSAVAKPQHDIGSDGLVTSIQENMRFGLDAGGYTLGYYDDHASGMKDYLAIGGASAEAFDMQDYINNTSTDLAQATHVNNTFNLVNTAYASLYNGNISRMTTSNTNILQQRMGTTVTAYRYDQANRIKGVKDINLLEGDTDPDEFAQVNNFATALSNYFASAGGTMSTLGGDYEVGYTYDKNGNLAFLKRQGNEVSATTAMDNLEYGYATGTNRLQLVEDGTTNSNHAGALEGDISYTYDAIGNLTSETYTVDPTGNNLTITWTAAGKVKEVTKNDETITFFYDPMGNRIAKQVVPTAGGGTYTRYARDASGNTLVTYADDLSSGGEGALDADWEIYGSSRLGTLTEKNATLGQEYGNKRYEFSNHLGNVLHTYTDHLIHNYQTLASHDLETNNPLTLDFQFPIGLISQSTNGGMQVDFQTTTTGFGSYLPTSILPKVVYTVSGNVIQGESYRILIDYATTNPGSSGAPGIASLALTAKQGSTVWQTSSILAPTQGTASLIFLAPASGPVTIEVEMVPIYDISETGPKGSTDYQINTQAGTAILSNLLIQGMSDGAYAADIQQANLYYPFGSTQPGRVSLSDAYRYGFNGMEKDSELKGEANSLDFGARVYDPRVARFLSIDPDYKLYPNWAPYLFAGDSPIRYIDENGEGPRDGVKIIVVEEVDVQTKDGVMKLWLKKTYYHNVTPEQEQQYLAAAHTPNGWILADKEEFDRYQKNQGKSPWYQKVKGDATPAKKITQNWTGSIYDGGRRIDMQGSKEGTYVYQSTHIGSPDGESKTGSITITVFNADGTIADETTRDFSEGQVVRIPMKVDDNQYFIVNESGTGNTSSGEFMTNPKPGNDPRSNLMDLGEKPKKEDIEAAQKKLSKRK